MVILSIIFWGAVAITIIGWVFIVTGIILWVWLAEDHKEALIHMASVWIGLTAAMFGFAKLLHYI